MPSSVRNGTWSAVDRLRGEPEPIDNDNPEWTAADIKRAKSFAGLPASLQTKLRGRPKAAAT